MKESFLSARWENLIMANYAVDPQVLRPFLPHGVEIDFYNAKTCLSLVDFMFKGTSLFNITIPFLGTFEELNLRFYVRRVEGETIKRGVVFINETVSYKPVAWLANKLYKEHYLAIPTKSSISYSASKKYISYEWKVKERWNQMAVNASKEREKMIPNSIEEFIFERFFGYSKLNSQQSHEYKVNHPSWEVNKVIDYSIQCDFTSMYLTDFSFLNSHAPDSVIVAEGSPVIVNWKRTTF